MSKAEEVWFIGVITFSIGIIHDCFGDTGLIVFGAIMTILGAAWYFGSIFFSHKSHL